MQRAGLIKHLRVSNVTAEQIAEAQSIAPVVCVQNFYNIANRRDNGLNDTFTKQGNSYLRIFMLTGFRCMIFEHIKIVVAVVDDILMLVSLSRQRNSYN